MCCTVLRVDEIGKRAGAPCSKLAPGGGCSIHSDRPGICRAYRCAWLEGKFREEDRPDRLGAVVDFAPRGVSFELVIVTAEPDGFERSTRLQEIAAAHRETLSVRVSDTLDVDDPDRPFRVLLARGEEHRVAGDRVTRLRDGEVISEGRLPFVERLARRVLVGARRLALWRAARRRI